MRQQVSPDEAWQQLLDGNRRFVHNEPATTSTYFAERAPLSAEQHPIAIVVACSDVRASPELIFDQELGQLFVVQTAGHIIGPAVLGSIEFGVRQLGIPLIVVLGHQSCSAVHAGLTALRTGEIPAGYRRHIVTNVIADTLISDPRSTELTEEQVQIAHVQQTAHRIRDRSTIVTEVISRDQLAIVAATHRLTDRSLQVETAIGTNNR